ncbi:MAG TPA: type IV pilus assembly protein PilM [Phycisphaerales bacterium]|nr:type IV pilus assembly protein PilM [Phycisphaerales bacterium]
MPSSNICWGIELGAAELKAVKLARSGDGLEVLDFVVIPHKRVLSAPEIDQADAQKVAASTLAGQRDLTGAVIAISVPGHSAFARFAKLPPVDPKKIKDIVKFEAVQQIPFPLDQVEWDYQTFQAPDSPEVEVGIFAMTRERVMERLGLWQDLGVTPEVITLSPVAAYNAVSYDLMFDEKTPGTVILDVGTTSTDLIVAEPGRAWVRTFPMGGHQFTEALVEAFKLSYLKAEKLKREAEQSKHARHVFQAMRPVFGDLSQEVQRSIGYYQSLHRDANLTRLIGIGSTFQLPGLRKYLSQQLQMEVVRLEQFNRLEVKGARADEFRAASPNLATCYGLALQGLGFDHGINANLMPVAVIRDALWHRKVKWFGLAAGLALAAGAVSFIRPMGDQMALQGAVKPAVIEEAKRALREARSEWKAVETAYKADFRGASALDLLERREVYPYLVDDLGRMMADAAAKAQASGTTEWGKAGFLFHSWQTRYVGGTGPTGAGGQEDAPAPRRSSRGRKRPAATDTNMGTFTSNETRPRLQVLLEISTAHHDPDALIRDSIQKWIADHSDRQGVPYILSKGSVDVQKTRVEIIKAPDAKAADAAAQRWARPDPEDTPPDDEPEEGVDPELLDPGRDEAPPPSEAMPIEPGRGGRPGVGPGEGAGPPPEGGGPAAPGTTNFTPGNAPIKDLAPLPAVPSPAPPDERVTTYQVRFEAVLREPKKPEGQS